MLTNSKLYYKLIVNIEEVIMKKYINGGIVKEISIFYTNKINKVDILSEFGDSIDLNLFNIKEYKDCIILELKDDILKNNIINFLIEIESFISPVFSSTLDNVKYIYDNFNKMDIDKLLNDCDDIFKDRYRFYDTFSINSDKYKVDVLYYGFYFDGPYAGGNFDTFLRYFHKLHFSCINNVLSGAICFGIN